MFYALIHEKVRRWADADACPVSSLLRYIRTRGALREPQIAAIETYLFLKIEGRGRSLANLFASGFFNDTESLTHARISQIARDRFAADPAALAIYQLCGALERAKGTGNRGLADLFERHVTAHPDADGFTTAIREIFYNAEYPDYLFSLPMGAGKTFLMAAFILLDLYFAVNEPGNPAFARNFIVLAPSGLKSSIVPSLRTIEHFDPSWVLPEPAASAIRKLVKFEVLDQPKSAKRSNRARNPNAQKLAAHMPFEDLVGLVLVVNAEKVILNRVEVDAQRQLIERNQEEKERLANELRHLIGRIPRLQIFIDEVQRAAEGDIKLRAVVNAWCRAGHISAVLGFSGTPYHDATRSIPIGPLALQSSTIANTVYYYPLATAIAGFLKKPRLEVARGLQSIEIVRDGVRRFMAEFGGRVYTNGACAKLAIYCGNIARLEEEVYPLLVGDLRIPPDRILKFHQGNKAHPIAKDAAAEFALLDHPASRRQIVLLVQIGKEGWDCRSLTGVILSQEGDCPRNMVLQTSCRCLRQVDGGPNETAFILLNESNATVLDKQLKEEQSTSIRELNAIRPAAPPNPVPRVSRLDRLGLPPLVFHQLRIAYLDVATGTPADPAATLAACSPDDFKSQATLTSRYLDERHAAFDNAFGLIRETAVISEQFGDLASFADWLNEIARESLGGLAFDALRPFRATLRRLFDRITYVERGHRRYNTLYDQSAIRSAIRLAFHTRRELRCDEETVRQDAALLIVHKLDALPEQAGLWPNPETRRKILERDALPPGPPPAMADIEAQRPQFKAIAEAMNNPALEESLLRDLVRKVQGEKGIDEVRSRTLHYLPYAFSQSDFERAMIEQVLALASFRQAGLEIYYNGERHLTEFRVDCYARAGRHWRRIGFYTPDFLVIRRESGDIRQVLILETKGRGFADQPGFVARRRFMEEDFIGLNNKAFGYARFDFLVLDDADMARNIERLNARIAAFFGRSDADPRSEPCL